jgi:LPPG:FO 2-phospho-L-lactate transferase
VIAVLAGGVGAARYLTGLLRAVAAEDVVAVVNTGDDLELHGLSISPDIDTITYTLAGSIDPERGWGLAGETWRAVDALDRFATVRPAGSTAAASWFRLGDLDLGTHLYRTHRLREGATLTAVTGEIAAAFGLRVRLLPMTDAPAPTFVRLLGGEEISFQEYFVARRHSVPIESVRFATDGVVASAAAVAALRAATRIVIAPSNPIVSIGPILSFREIIAVLRERRADVVAVSPIVAGAALKGPADRMLVELGHEPTVVGVARIYAPVAATLVIDDADATLAPAVDATGVRAVVTDTIMSRPGVAAALARTTLQTLT